jgi:hypothetical protein
VSASTTSRPAGRLQSGQRVRLGPFRHRHEQRRRRRASEHGRRRQERPRRLGERRHPLAHALGGVPGHPLRPRPDVPPPERLGVADDEERHAPGAPEHQLPQRRGAARADPGQIRTRQQGIEEVPAVVWRERRQLQVGDQSGVRPVGQGDPQNAVWLHLGVSVRADDAQRRELSGMGERRVGPHQRGEELERVALGPLQVVERQQDAAGRAVPPLRHVGQEAGDRPEHQAALLLGGEGPAR